MAKGQPLAARFWSKVDKRGPDECWPWMGTRLRPGYGVMQVSGKRVRATRVSWSLHNGAPFPQDRIACHSCDNPNCVNPAHIWAGTHSENTRDMIAKGRHPKMRGQGSPRAPRKRAYGSMDRQTCLFGHPLLPSPYPSERHTRRCIICHNEHQRIRRAKKRKS